MGVGVIAQQGGRVAMGLRRHRGEKVWSLPGGKVEPFEPVLVCGERELTEETCLVASALKIFAVCEFIEEAEHYHTVTFGAVAETVTGELTNVEPRIFDAWKWFDLTNIPSPLFPPSYHLLAAYRTASSSPLILPETPPGMIAHCRLTT